MGFIVVSLLKTIQGIFHFKFCTQVLARVGYRNLVRVCVCFPLCSLGAVPMSDVDSLGCATLSISPWQTSSDYRAAGGLGANRAPMRLVQMGRWSVGELLEVWGFGGRTFGGC